MNELHLECNRCKVSSHCPRNGSSPHIFNKKKILCIIVGGYGRKPVDLEILSEESKALVEKNGPCLTIATVPTTDPDSGMLYMELTKIFHQPILHERETTSFQQNALYPKSHN